MRYIEVLTNARIERAIEAYEATLEFIVSTGKRESCVDESVVLRNDVVAALKDSGLSSEDIREGGGEASQPVWFSTKSVIRRVIIRNASMEPLMSAMAAMERLFAALKQPYFSRVKKSFTFYSPIPLYASNTSADEVIRTAITKARLTAALIAQESGVRLGGLLSVVESTSTHPHEPVVPQISNAPDPKIELYEYEHGRGPSGSTYSSTLPAATKNSARHFRVRFSIEEAQQSNENRSAEPNGAS